MPDDEEEEYQMSISDKAVIEELRFENE